MSSSRILLALMASSLLGPGCSSQIGEPVSSEDDDDSADTPADDAESSGPSPAQVTVTYLSDLAPILVGRVLSPEDAGHIADRIEAGADAQDAVREVLEDWADDPFIAETARELVQTTLSISGQRDGIDFDQPGNLARLLVTQKRSWTELLTADSCVGNDLSPADCGTGAPYTAGVLGTRAYLASRASRFNLTRASTMMATFACQHYPLAEDVEPRLPRDKLIDMFQVDAPENPDDPDSGNVFGNGSACYACHGQFGAHAQFFVRFDSTGVWKPDATGVQDPGDELGRSAGGLFASHLSDPGDAANPRSQMLGQPAENLAEAAAILAASPAFVRCTARRLLGFGLRLDDDSTVPDDLLAEIAERLSVVGGTTFQHILIESFAHPRVIQAATAYLETAEPGQGELP